MSMDAASDDLVVQRLLHLLQRHPAGIKEYDLLQECRQEGLPFWNGQSLLDSLELYRVHFLLFHFLYILRERLLREKAGDLEIHCLCIKLLPWPGEHGTIPALADPLTGYYRNLERLEQTTRQETEAMLDSFWQHFCRWDQRKEALAVLDLADPVENEDILRRYRQLVKHHHPDRGGDANLFRQINEAMKLLRPIR